MSPMEINHKNNTVISKLQLISQHAEAPTPLPQLTSPLLHRSDNHVALNQRVLAVIVCKQNHTNRLLPDPNTKTIK